MPAGSSSFLGRTSACYSRTDRLLPRTRPFAVSLRHARGLVLIDSSGLATRLVRALESSSDRLDACALRCFTAYNTLRIVPGQQRHRLPLPGDRLFSSGSPAISCTLRALASITSCRNSLSDVTGSPRANASNDFQVRSVSDAVMASEDFAATLVPWAR